MTDPELNPCAWPVLACTCGGCENPVQTREIEFQLEVRYEFDDLPDYVEVVTCWVSWDSNQEQEYKFTPSPIDERNALEHMWEHPEYLALIKSFQD